MRLTIQIPTHIEVDKFKKDHKAFLNYLSKHCTYSIEQSSNGYGYTSFVCGPVREKSLHAFIDNYFKLFLEEIDEMKDTDFERLCIPRMITGEALLSWQRFKELHPNTPENPDYSEASVKRWLYHINEAEKNKGFEKVEIDLSHIELIRKNARVREFSDFDYQKKGRYLSIAKCYPGSQVFACGSQVRGDYFDNFNMEGIIQAREKAGMQTHRVSDYDYWVHPTVLNASILPEYSDRYRGKFNEKEMVAIPIYYGDV